VYLKNMQV